MILLAAAVGFGTGALFWGLALAANQRSVAIIAALHAAVLAALILAATHICTTRIAAGIYVVSCGAGAAIVVARARRADRGQRYDLPDRRARNRRLSDREEGSG